MARSHGRIHTRIWDPDDDFVDLTPGGQRLYMFLLTQRDLNQAGLIALRPERWANMARDLTVEQVMQDLWDITEGRFVAVDETTQEVLIRTFIRGDGVWKQPNVMIRAGEDAGQITSPALREVFLAELDRLDLSELSDQPGKGLRSPQEIVRDVIEGFRRLHEERSRKGSAKGSRKGSAGCSAPVWEGYASPPGQEVPDGPSGTGESDRQDTPPDGSGPATCGNVTNEGGSGKGSGDPSLRAIPLAPSPLPQTSLPPSHVLDSPAAQDHERSGEGNPPGATPQVLADVVLAIAPAAQGAVALLPACQRLVGFGWTAPQLEAEASRWNLHGSEAGAIINRLKALAHPPAAPRSGAPASPQPCPRHPGQPATRCVECPRESAPPPAPLRQLRAQAQAATA